jgi:ribosomal protein S18 acetylase RimI-like enzyme
MKLNFSIKSVTAATPKGTLLGVAELFDQYRQFYGQVSNLEAAKQFLQDRLKKSECVIFAALKNEQPVGFVQLYPFFTSVGLSRTWILNDLFVAPQERRHGIAKALMEESISHTRKTGASKLSLETGRTNTSAQELYRKLNFSQDNDCIWFHLKA